MSQEAMNPQTARKLLEVGEAFRIPGPFFSYEEIKMGNVNHTYKVNYIRDDGTGMAKVKSYLVQRVNTYAFQRPVELMKNIDGVTGHIRQKHPGAQYLHFHHTQDGCNYLFDEDGFWRLSNYVPSVTYDSCDDLGVVRSAGEAFGSFQMMLSDFDASSLYYTIPDFHNTRKRYALVVIDLDTVMPGLVGHDFGDAIRFAANFVEEDSPRADKAGVNLNVYWAFAEGFLKETAATLTPREVETLGLSCFALACELATRFLDDYIVGDKYFKIKNAEHNLVRTRCQIALAKDMLLKMDAMNAIVMDCYNRYR